LGHASRAEASVRTFGFRALFAVGILVAIYLVYAHVAALHDGLIRASGVAWSTRFAEPTEFTRDFDTDKSADFDVDARVGALAVHRTGGPGDGHAKLLSKPMHFDGGMARMRFRVKERAAYDVFVGLERADHPDKRLWLVLRNDVDHPSFRLEGTDGLRGPTPPESLLDYVDGTDVMTMSDEWHVLALRFEPTSQTTEVSIDDVPVASRLVGWSGGFDARLVFGVRDRQASAINVEIAEVGWNPQDGRAPERVPDFEDMFAAARLDPLRWQVFFQKEWRVDSGIEPSFETGHGLLLRGRGLSQSAPGGHDARSNLHVALPTDAHVHRSHVGRADPRPRLRVRIDHQRERHALGRGGARQSRRHGERARRTRAARWQGRPGDIRWA
jgi:hypothetical protein